MFKVGDRVMWDPESPVAGLLSCYSFVDPDRAYTIKEINSSGLVLDIPNDTPGGWALYAWKLADKHYFIKQFIHGLPETT